MTTQIFLVALIALGLFFIRQRRLHRFDHLAPVDGSLVNDEPITVQLEPLGDEGTDFRWVLLSYSDGSATSRIRVGYEPVTAAPGELFAFARGLLQPVTGSAPAPLMGALAAMHESIDIPVALPSAEEVRIDVGMLGTGLSIGVAKGNVIAGGFTSATPGNWTVLKLFIHSDDDDGDTGELYLALDEVQRTAQFLLKDPAYWPSLAPTFARLLAGTPA